jgi:pyruvate dehydrogenase E2 component (dihydrolipoamide acetyltransferase)
MATEVILPALGMAQDSGKIVRWLKTQGERVMKGEPLVEIETDKVTVEIEAPTSGILSHILSAAGEEVPVGQVIALISATGEAPAQQEERTSERRQVAESAGRPEPRVSPTEAAPGLNGGGPQNTDSSTSAVPASVLASRIAAEHQVDLGKVKAAGPRVQKADVLAYLRQQNMPVTVPSGVGRVPASPKARRLAREQGKDLAKIVGTGPEGAVLAGDVLAGPADTFASPSGEATTVSTIWRIMVERTAQTWTNVPHFYLVREINASRLIAWREHLVKRGAQEITYTDLLVKIAATALRLHPRVNSTWSGNRLTLMRDIHLGLPVAIEEGLVVPVIHHADTLGLRELARQRRDLVAKARAGKLRPQDISGGTFSISNLGMYGVDAFNAIINSPQAAILAVGRIAERVVPVNGRPEVQPMLTLTLSCDHRAIDGALGAQFLATLASLIEEPLGLLDGAEKRENEKED